MSTATLAIVASCGGKSLQKTISETFDHPNNYEDIPLSAGKEVSSWVKADLDTAECSLPSGHGYSSGKFDVYWTGGVRYGVDGTVTSDTLTLDGGSGDDFPATATESIVVCPPKQIDTAIDGDNVAFFVANSTQRSHLHFKDAAGDSIAAIKLIADNPYTWNASSGQDNPLSGDPITICWASNGTTTDATLDILCGADATP